MAITKPKPIDPRDAKTKLGQDLVQRISDIGLDPVPNFRITEVVNWVVDAYLVAINNDHVYYPALSILLKRCEMRLDMILGNNDDQNEVMDGVSVSGPLTGVTQGDISWYFSNNKGRSSDYPDTLGAILWNDYLQLVAQYRVVDWGF